MQTTTKKPELFEIVKIESRWAQVRGDDKIIYLKDGVFGHIDWEDYDLSEKVNLTVDRFNKAYPEIKITDSEIQNIWWGAEQEKHPELKQAQLVSGMYELKKRIKYQSRH